MDNFTIRQSIEENRYYADRLMGRRSEGDTIYSVMAFPETNNPDRFTVQDRDMIIDLE